MHTLRGRASNAPARSWTYLYLDRAACRSVPASPASLVNRQLRWHPSQKAETRCRSSTCPSDWAHLRIQGCTESQPLEPAGWSPPLAAAMGKAAPCVLLPARMPSNAAAPACIPHQLQALNPTKVDTARKADCVRAVVTKLQARLTSAELLLPALVRVGRLALGHRQHGNCHLRMGRAAASVQPALLHMRWGLSWRRSKQNEPLHVPPSVAHCNCVRRDGPQTGNAHLLQHRW